MSHKRAHIEVTSPRSDSDNEELSRYSRRVEEPPLLPFRPPSVEGGRDPLLFGESVDGVPISLPVPRLLDPPESNQILCNNAHVGLGSASPTAVTATPLSRLPTVTTGSQPLLEAIPEHPDAEAERASTEPSPAFHDVDVLPHGASPSQLAQAQSPAPAGLLPEAVQVTLPASSRTPSPSSAEAFVPIPIPSVDAGEEACADASVGTKRRKAIMREDEGDSSPDVPRTRARAAQPDEVISLLQTPEVALAEVDVLLPFRLSVELPAVATKFAPVVDADTSSDTTEAPLYPLRPPSVSGCTELLRFGDELGGLPLPTSEESDEPEAQDAGVTEASETTTPA